MRYLAFELAKYHRPMVLKTATLLLALVLSVLVNTRAITISNPWLATVISFVAVLVLPGFLLLGLVFERGEMSWSERLPVAFALGMGVLGLPGLLLFILHENLDTLSWISVSLNVVLAGLYIRSTRDSNTSRDVSGSDDRLNPFLLAVVLISIFVVVSISLSTASTWPSGDNWTYLRQIRRYLDASQLTEINLRVNWLVLQAFLDNVVRVEPVDVYFLYLPPLLLILSLLAFYSLAKELFKSQNAALFATLVQVLYCLSSIGSPNWIGRGFFARIIEDKFLVWLIILPVAILLMLKYLSAGKSKYLLPLALSAAVLSVTHPMGLILCGMSFAPFALVHLLFNPQITKILRFVIIFAFMVLFLLAPLAQRQMMVAQATEGAAFEYAAGTETKFNLSRTRLRVFSAVENRFMAHPHLIAHPFTVLAILLTPLLIQYLRKSLTAQFLFSNMAVTLLLLYNPVTAPLLGRIITPWMLWRVSWLLPVSLTVGFFSYRIIRWIQRVLMRYSFFAARSSFLQMMPVLVVILASVPLQGRIADGLAFLREGKEKAMSQHERSLLVHLRENVVPGSVVVAEPPINTHIPAFAGAARVLTFRTGGLPLTREDIDRFYKASLVSDSVLDILERWTARYVIVEGNHELALQFDLLPSLFTRLYGNAEHELYEVLPDPGPNHVVAGNTHLVRGEWEEAIAEYEKALALNPDDTLAYLGLGQAYQIQARRKEAQAAYKQAIAIHPDNVMARLALAKLYAVEGKIEKAINQYQAAIELRPNYLASFEALGDLYRAQGEDDEAFRQYRKAITFPSDTGDYHLALGDLCWAKGLLDRAIAEYKETIAIDPRSGKTVKAYLGLGKAYQAQGRLDDAVAAYRQVIALAPDNKYGYTPLGSIYQAEGLTEQAVALYRDATRRNLNSAWPHIELGKIYLRQETARVSHEKN
jgi:tetratricopeptide (TPR) repeat protein